MIYRILETHLLKIIVKNNNRSEKKIVTKMWLQITHILQDFDLNEYTFFF